MSDFSIRDFLYTLRYRRVRPLVVFCILFVIIALSIMGLNTIKNSTRILEEENTDLSIVEAKLTNERNKMQNEIRICETDDYIIAKARQLYGYMMPDELRFIVKNPEALGIAGETIELYVVESSD